jgi:tetratricopeptide (TPR) repeat protein
MTATTIQAHPVPQRPPGARWSLAALVLLLFAPFPRGAALAGPAEDDETKAQAKRLFESGERNYQRGEYQKALADYQAAVSLLPHPAILFNIAQCHRQLMQPVFALKAYQHYLEEWRRQRPSKTIPFEEEVQEHIAKLSRIVELAPRVDIRTGSVLLDGRPRPAGIFVDEVQIERRELPATLELAPGAHRVRIVVEGFDPWERDVVSRLGESQVERVVLSRGRSIGWLVAGISTAVLAAASLVVGIAYNVKARGLVDGSSEWSAAANAGRAGYILAGVFAAASTTGFVIYALSGSTDGGPSPGAPPARATTGRSFLLEAAFRF